nr:hypothetical protein [Tanacetum cinerariifolium]
MPRKKSNVLAQHLQKIMEDSLVDDRVKELTKTHVPIYVAQGLIMERQQNQADVEKMIADAIQQECKNLRANISSQKTYEHGTYVFEESSYGQDNKSEPDDDELLTEKVSQDLVNEISKIVDEAKLRKQKRNLSFNTSQKPTLAVQSCQRDPKALALSLVNQDLMYLKKGNSGPEKIVMSLHTFHAVIFPDDEIKERTSRWVDKCVKKFNPYARYIAEH